MISRAWARLFFQHVLRRLPHSRHWRRERLVALLEAFKGLLVPAAGFGLLAVAHEDLQQLAEELVGHFD